MKILIQFLLLITFAFVSIAQLKSATNNSNEPDTTQKQVEKIGDDTYRIGKIIIDTKTLEITFDGIVNQDSGMIELVACAPGGKTHESIFVWDVQPYHLQISLLLLGLNYGGGVFAQGDTNAPRGDSVYVFVSWEENGKIVTHRAEDFVWNVAEKRPMENVAWIFTGSKIVNGIFMAEQQRSLLTTYRDPFTILDNPLQGGANDDLYIANHAAIPPKGTKVHIRIQVP
jgi:hypothetical protein